MKKLFLICLVCVGCSKMENPYAQDLDNLETRQSNTEIQVQKQYQEIEAKLAKLEEEIKQKDLTTIYNLISNINDREKEIIKRITNLTEARGNDNELISEKLVELQDQIDKFEDSVNKKLRQKPMSQKDWENLNNAIIKSSNKR